MKKSLNILAASVGCTLLLSACASNTPPPHQIATNFIQKQDVRSTTTEHYPAKNPQTVVLYDEAEKKPLTPYRVIGVASVSQYNLLGMKRTDTTVHTMMKNLAASIGGDGIINVSQKNGSVEAKVIAFQKIML